MTASLEELQYSRLQAIAKAQIIIVKVGSAVLTGKEGLDCQVINSLACQLAKIRTMFPPGEAKPGFRKIVLVSSGAVAAGRAALFNSGKKDFTNIKKAKHGIAAVGQGLLMHAWNMAFAPHAILTGQVLLTRDDLRARQRFQIAGDTFSEMLDWGVVPIVNENDTVSVLGLKFGDNDYLASLLVNLVEADLFINLTSAPGVMDGNPDRVESVHPIDFLENINSIDIDSLCGAPTSSGSGGMRSKLLAARRVAQLGVPTLILPGRTKDILVKSFESACKSDFETQKIQGTWVCPSERAIPRRKFWLAYQSAPAGEIDIDDGAARALLHEGRSLLPGGISHVTGDFSSGDLLLVKHDGKNLGVGFSNYSSEDLMRICGLKRHEVAAILGKARYPDVIHRDNLLLDAAIQD